MPYTKKQVDQQVSRVEKTLEGHKERCLRGYSFARMYMQVSLNPDLKAARMQLEKYLSVQDNDDQAHRLMGQVLLVEGEVDKAILHMRRSIDIRKDQPDLILTVAELYSKLPKEAVVVEKLESWLRVVKRIAPHHTAVFKLQEKILKAKGQDSATVIEKLLSQQMLQNTGDVELYLRMVDLHCEMGQWDKAYQECRAVDYKQQFKRNWKWNQKALWVYETYYQKLRGDSRVTPLQELASMLTLLQSLIQNFVTLYGQRDSQPLCAGVLLKVDKCVLAATRKLGRIEMNPKMLFYHLVTREMCGSMYYLAALYCLKYASPDQVDRMIDLGLVCLLSSLRAPLFPSTGPWLPAVTLEEVESIRMWAASRISQTCHVLHLMESLRGANSVDVTVKGWDRERGKRELLEGLFGAPLEVTFADKKIIFDIKESFLFLDSNLSDLASVLPQVPPIGDLRGVDSMKVCNDKGDLPPLLWLSMSYSSVDVPPPAEEWVQCLFIGMSLSTPNLARTSHDALCQLDLEAALHIMAARCRGQLLAHSREGVEQEHRAWEVKQLVTTHLDAVEVVGKREGEREFEEFWTSALQLNTGQTSGYDAPQLKARIQEGLKKIRLQKPSSLSLQETLSLARHFKRRAEALANMYQQRPWHFKEIVKNLLEYSCMFWKRVLELLDSPPVSAYSHPVPRLFSETTPSSASPTEDVLIMEEAFHTLGNLSLHKNDPLTALKHYKKISTPQALFNCSQIYVMMANRQEKRDPNRKAELLSMAARCIRNALGHLRRPSHDDDDDLQHTLRIKLVAEQDKIRDQIQAEGLVDHKMGYNSDGSDVSDELYPSSYTFSHDDRPRGRTHSLNEDVDSREMGSEGRSEGKEEDEEEEFSSLSSLDDDELGDSLYSVDGGQDQDRGSFSSGDEATAGQETESQENTTSPPPSHSRRTPLSKTGTTSPSQQGTMTYSADDRSPARSYHSDSSGHPVEEFRLSRRSHHELVRTLEDKNAELNAMKKRILNLEKENKLLRKHQPKVPPSGHVYESPQRYGDSMDDSLLATQQHQTPPPTDPGTLTSPSIKQSPHKTPPRITMATPPSITKVAAPMSTPVVMETQASYTFEGVNTVVWGSPAGLPPPVPTGEVSQLMSTTGIQWQPSSTTAGIHSQAAYPKWMPTDQRYPSSMASKLNKDSLFSMMEPLNPRTPSALSYESVQESDVGESEEDGQHTSHLQHPLMFSHTSPHKTQFPSPKATRPTPQTSLWKCPNCLVTGLSGPACPCCSHPRPDSTSTPASGSISGSISILDSFGPLSKSEAVLAPLHSTMRPESTPVSTGGGMRIGWNLSSLTQPTTGPLSGDVKLNLPKLSSSEEKHVQASPQEDKDNPEKEAEIHFEPVVRLSEDYSVKTGEEEDEVLFAGRAKLYRFEGSEWKERGIGELKMLQSSKSGKARLLMRRDQVLKVCCNHFLSEGMSLTPMLNSDKSWIWFTPSDYSEETAQAEKFAARFKTKEIAEEFREAFEKNKKVKEVAGALEERWTCDVCFDDNPVTANECQNCENPRAPGTVVTSKPALPTPAITTPTTSTPSIVPGGPLGNLMRLTSQAEVHGNSPQARMGLKAQLGMGSGGLPVRERDPTEEATEEDHPEKEVNIHFEPVVRLSEDYSVKTGEEEDEVLFAGRAKLYRFEGSEWKERGIGELKMLQSSKSGKARLLMRRDQVLKVCCNHFLSEGMSLTPMLNSDKSWIWFTPSDYSEETAQAEKFAARFKTREIAEEFREAFERAKLISSKLLEGDGPPGLESASEISGFSQMMPRLETDTYGGHDSDDSERPQTPPDKDGGSWPTAMPTTSVAPPTTLPSVYIPPRTGHKVQSKPFAEFPMPSAGEWMCHQCGCPNSTDKLWCVKCEAPIDRTKAKFRQSGFVPSTDSTEGRLKLPPKGWTFSDNTLKASTNVIKLTDTQQDSKAEPSMTEGAYSDLKNQKVVTVPSKPDKWTCSSCSTENSDLVTVCVKCTKNKPLQDEESAVEPHPPPVQDTPTEDWSDEVEIIKVEVATPEQIKMARKYMLPDHFYLYKSRPPCPGCRGCDDDLKGPHRLHPKEKEKRKKMWAINKDDKPVVSSMISSQPFSITHGQPFSTASSQPFSFTSSQPFSRMFAPSEGSLFRTPQQPVSTPTAKGGGLGFEWMSTGTSKGFQSGTRLFGTVSQSSPAASEQEGEDNPEKEAEIHFEPVVHLSEDYSVKTGEEEDEVLFAERAKLYRFDGSEWKERGTGELKMLQSSKSGKARLLMRRDQVLKVCCNHFLSEGMSLTPMLNSDKSWIWFTPSDYSEETAQAEKFAARFKTREIAEEFREAFERNKALEHMVETPEGIDLPKTEGLPTLLQPLEGAWECPGCYLSITGGDKCPACTAMRPGSTSTGKPSEDSSPPKLQFSEIGTEMKTTTNPETPTTGGFKITVPLSSLSPKTGTKDTPVSTGGGMRIRWNLSSLTQPTTGPLPGDVKPNLPKLSSSEEKHVQASPQEDKDDLEKEDKLSPFEEKLSTEGTDLATAEKPQPSVGENWENEEEDKLSPSEEKQLTESADLTTTERPRPSVGENWENEEEDKLSPFEEKQLTESADLTTTERPRPSVGENWENEEEDKLSPSEEKQLTESPDLTTTERPRPSVGENWEEEDTSHEVLGDTSHGVSENTFQEVLGDTSHGVLEDTSHEVLEDTSQEVLEDTSHGVSEDTSQEVLGDTSHEVLEDTSQEVLGDTSHGVLEDTSHEVSEDTSQEVLGDTSHGVLEDTSQEVLEDTSQEVLGDTSQEVLEDTSQGVLGDTMVTVSILAETPLLLGQSTGPSVLAVDEEDQHGETGGPKEDILPKDAHELLKEEKDDLSEGKSEDYSRDGKEHLKEDHLKDEVREDQPEEEVREDQPEEENLHLKDKEDEQLKQQEEETLKVEDQQEGKPLKDDKKQFKQEEPQEEGKLQEEQLKEDVSEQPKDNDEDRTEEQSEVETKVPSARDEQIGDGLKEEQTASDVVEVADKNVQVITGEDCKEPEQTTCKEEGEEVETEQQTTCKEEGEEVETEQQTTCKEEGEEVETEQQTTCKEEGEEVKTEQQTTCKEEGEQVKTEQQTTCKEEGEEVETVLVAEPTEKEGIEELTQQQEMSQEVPKSSVDVQKQEEEGVQKQEEEGVQKQEEEGVQKQEEEGIQKQEEDVQKQEKEDLQGREGEDVQKQEVQGTPEQQG